MGYRVSHLILGAAVVAKFGVWTTEAAAQTFTVQSITPAGSAGTLTAGAVTLTLSPSGSFSPSGYQRSTSSLTYTVKIKCVDGSGSMRHCSNNALVMVIKDTGSSGVSRIDPLQNFTVASSLTTASAASGSNPTTLSLSGMTNNSTATLSVGFGVPLLSSGATGVTTSRTFTLGVGLSTSSITSSMTGVMSATVWNPISVGVTSNLSFGQVIKPNAGTTTFTLTPTGGLTASSGNGAIVASSTHSAAGFNVTGEGAQAFSLRVPSSFTMTGSGNTLTVTTTASFSSTSTLTTQSFSGTLGALGSFPFTVGGLLPVAATSTSGAYTGNLIVSVNYN